jgi:hypothetical protein
MNRNCMKRQIHCASSATETLGLCSEYYTHSTWAPFVTCTMSKQYSSSSHVPYSMSTSTVATVGWILFHCKNELSCHEVATNLQKAQCVEWFIKTKLDTQVQRHFRTMYHKMPLSRPSICAWYKQCMENRSVFHKKGAERLVLSDENFESIQKVFICSPCKSIRAAACEMQMAHQQCIGCYVNVCTHVLQVASGAGNYVRW